MRIISQCKTKSVEFYNVALLRRDETIFARTALLASPQISTTCQRNKQ